MKRWTHIDWFILILFAVLVALFYWRILTPNPADRQSFPPGDFSAQFWAFTTFEVRELSAGRLPLWNPYTFAGSPFWADVQSAVFYPPSLLTLLLSAPAGFSLFALEVEAIAHFWLAATFMYLFAREITGEAGKIPFTYQKDERRASLPKKDPDRLLLGETPVSTFGKPRKSVPGFPTQNRAAAVIAALTFTFSGYLTGYPGQQLAVLEVDVWLPLILLFIYKASRRVSESANLSPVPLLLLAGVAWGIALLAGHPQSYFIVACLSSAYFFFLWLNKERESEKEKQRARSTIYVLRFLKSLPAWFIFIFTGLGLAAIQLIPAIQYTLLSVRAGGTYDKMSGGLPLTDLVQLLLPGQVSVYSPLYVGVVGLILAGWVVFAQPTRHTTFWAVVAFITLLIALGGHTFLYSPLYLFTPGFSIFRGQERWAFAFAFSLSTLAGYGFNTLFTQITGSIDHLPSPSSLSSPASPPPSLLCFTQFLFFFALLLTFLFFYGVNDTGWSKLFSDLLGAATLLTILLALAWLLWTFAPRLPLPLFTGLTAALICFNLFTANWQTNLYPQLPEWHTPMPNLVAAIKEDAAQTPTEPYRVYNEFRLYDNYGVAFAVEDLWGASPLRPQRYDEFLAPPMPIERTWELLNVKYVITWRQELYLPSTIIYQEPANGDTTYVHRLNTVGPRAWLVTQTETADDQTILKKIADPNFDRWTTALLEPGTPWQAPNEKPINNLQLTIHNSQLMPARLTYQITAPTSALLILSETYYPGWQATVNGQAAPLFRANYVLRAVPVPAGEHTVELTFRPLTFTLGAVVSAVTLLTVLGLLIFYRYRRAQPERPAL